MPTVRWRGSLGPEWWGGRRGGSLITVFVLVGIFCPIISQCDRGLQVALIMFPSLLYLAFECDCSPIVCAHFYSCIVHVHVAVLLLYTHWPPIHVLPAAPVPVVPPKSRSHRWPGRREIQLLNCILQHDSTWWNVVTLRPWITVPTMFTTRLSLLCHYQWRIQEIEKGGSKTGILGWLRPLLI